MKSFASVFFQEKTHRIFQIDTSTFSLRSSCLLLFPDVMSFEKAMLKRKVFKKIYTYTHGYIG